MRSSSGVVTFVLAVAVLAWIAGFGSAVVKYPPLMIPPAGAAAPKNFGLFNEAWTLIRSQFYGHMPTEDVITASSIEGVVSALEDDPYAAYISASTVLTATANFEPAWVPSAGIWILPVARGARILSIEPTGPAAKTDLTPGDTIALIDDDPLAGLGRDALVKILDGKAGTKLQAVIVPESGAARAIDFARVAATTPTATTKALADGATLLRLPSVSKDVLPALDAALDKLPAGGAANGIVIDLRDNPGGPLADLPEVGGRFLKDGVLFTAVDKAGAESATQVAAAASRLQVAAGSGIAVLINDGTYGTAEILAAALRDGLGARLVGEPSGGADGLQSFVGLGDGSQLRLTTAHWKSRAGLLADAKGLKPDIQVTAPRAQTTSDADPQLAAALSVLKEKQAAESASR